MGLTLDGGPAGARRPRLGLDDLDGAGIDQLVATATDVDGTGRVREATLTVIDPTDTSAPATALSTLLGPGLHHVAR